MHWVVSGVPRGPRPVGYPVDEERVVVLEDGRRVLLRPVVPGDFYESNVMVQRLVAASNLPEQRSVDHGVVADTIDLRPLVNESPVPGVESA